MDITTVELAAKKFVGMKFAGPFAALPVEMPKLWATFLSRVAEVPHEVVDKQTFYGVGDEDFQYKTYTEFIAVEVERLEEIPHGMYGFTIPALRYLKATHRGPMTGVQETYMRLFQWMKEHGYEQDRSALRIERYDQRFIPSVHAPDREENEYEILVPLVSKR